MSVDTPLIFMYVLETSKDPTIVLTPGSRLIVIVAPSWSLFSNDALTKVTFMMCRGIMSTPGDLLVLLLAPVDALNMITTSRHVCQLNKYYKPIIIFAITRVHCFGHELTIEEWVVVAKQCCDLSTSFGLDVGGWAKSIVWDWPDQAWVVGGFDCISENFSLAVDFLQSMLWQRREGDNYAVLSEILALRAWISTELKDDELVRYQLETLVFTSRREFCVISCEISANAESMLSPYTKVHFVKYFGADIVAAFGAHHDMHVDVEGYLSLRSRIERIAVHSLSELTGLNSCLPWVKWHGRNFDGVAWMAYEDSDEFWTDIKMPISKPGLKILRYRSLRQAWDGAWYTRVEFHKYYGERGWYEFWNNAPASANSRARDDGLSELLREIGYY